MKPLIYAKEDLNVKAYEENKLIKALKGCLEAADFPYTTSVFGDYNFVHFINIDDINKINDAKRENLPIVMNAMYSEMEKYAAMTTTGIRKKTLKNKIKKCLNLADVVLVPGVRAKKFLEAEGVVSKIELFPVPTRNAKPEAQNSINPYQQQLNIKSDCVLCVGDYTNKIEIYNFLEIAELCYSIKFCFIGSNYSQFAVNKYIKSGAKNVTFLSLANVEEYRQNLLNSKIFLVLDAKKVELSNVLEAMMAKTQLVVYNNQKVEEETFLKDGVNCYIRGGIYDIADCIDKFVKNKISSTINGAYSTALNFDFKNSGERLVRIYKVLLENKKEKKFYYD